MKFSITLITSAISLSCFLNAQSETDPFLNPDVETSGKRTCRIIFPERPNNSPKVAYLFDGKESQRVNLPSMNFSKVIALPKGELTLLLTPTEITDLENLPLNAPRLRIPEEVKGFYILMSPDASNKLLPLRMNLVNTSDGKLKNGETLWFNLTEHRIVAKLGESKMSVTPKSTTVTKDPASVSGYYTAQFAYQPEAKGEFYRITEQNWWHDAESKHVGFIVNTGGRLPKIYFYRDFRL
jgi:hypothetical protein